MTVNNSKGFTLIELLIVVVIIGILAAIAIPKFSATREKAYVAAMKADLRNLATAQDLYYANDNDGNGETDYTYSAALPADFSESEGVTVTVGGADQEGWSATATHAALAGVGCAVFYGSGANAAAATPGGIAATSSGAIVCDAI